MEFSITDYFQDLAQITGVESNAINAYWNDLNADVPFLSNINDSIKNVAAFGGRQFQTASEMRAFRCLLYVMTRIVKPTVFIETGVHNGMSSAFILLAMKHNKLGHLYSIDLPPLEQRILDQGTNALPESKAPGWIIPDNLRDNHTLLLGGAEELLPQVLAKEKSIDVFLHDSDHCYSHMLFEISLAWRYLKVGGFIMIDNIEQNAAFTDFARGVDAPSLVVSTFKGEERTWQHGLVRKTRPHDPK
jgi:predicted O-methyltransferase YrrM